ncbi:MAG: D-glycerate dehydrogenase [Candidatus Sericytochromatia bacterium]
MKVFISRIIPEVGINLIKDNGFDLEIWQEDRPMTQDELIYHSKKSDALLCMLSDKIDKKFLEECKHLKVISQYAVGFDNIDIKTATELKIPIGNTPDVLSESTADLAFTLMLMVSRKALHCHKKILNSQWTYFKPTEDLGIELKNKTLGIFGLGRIGFEMAKRCKDAYNMNIIYNNRSRNIDLEEKLNAEYVSFDNLLKQSDILSVHSSLNESTKEIFNLSAFQKMKKDSIFINTARGGIHNEKDLIKALEMNLLWGVGLDVTNPEPMNYDNPLLFMSNVTILPHIGSATKESRDGMARLSTENIILALKGQRVCNIVNPEIYN